MRRVCGFAGQVRSVVVMLRRDRLSLAPLPVAAKRIESGALSRPFFPFLSSHGVHLAAAPELGES